MRLLHHDRLQTILWLHARDEQKLDRDAASTVSLARWLEQRDQLGAGNGVRGVRVPSGAPLTPLLADLPTLQLIVLEIDSFADGRAFSTVRLLRERYRFSGEIRLRGNFLVDQIDLFLRAGVDSFELPETMDANDALQVARRRGVSYQPDVATHRLALDRKGLVVH